MLRIGLGNLVRALEGWTVCIDGCGEECTVCVWLPGWAKRLRGEERALLALYLAARATMDYRVVAAMHLYATRHRVALRPELYARARREARVEARVPHRIEDETPYAWEAVLYKGILYAEAVKQANSAHPERQPQPHQLEG